MIPSAAVVTAAVVNTGAGGSGRGPGRPGGGSGDGTPLTKDATLDPGWPDNPKNPSETGPFDPNDPSNVAPTAWAPGGGRRDGVGPDYKTPDGLTPIKICRDANNCYTNPTL